MAENRPTSSQSSAVTILLLPEILCETSPQRIRAARTQLRRPLHHGFPHLKVKSPHVQSENALVLLLGRGYEGMRWKWKRTSILISFALACRGVAMRASVGFQSEMGFGLTVRNRGSYGICTTYSILRSPSGRR